MLWKLAVGLRECRKAPTSMQHLRAANTAGALLAGYFPHLRGTFCFPPHLAAMQDVPLACESTFPVAGTASAQYPQFETTRLCAQEPVSTEELAAAKSDAPALDKDGNRDHIEAVRNSVVATLMAREYGPRLNRLEDKCHTLMTSNQQLKGEAQEAQKKSEKSRELNRRLCREVNESRSERAAVMEEVVQMKQHVEQSREQFLEAQREQAVLREALMASQMHVLELSGSECDPRKEISPEVWLTHGTEEKQVDKADIMADVKQEGVCSCNSHSAWGCTVHRSYSANLLLAHRDMSRRVQQGPPGLA